MVQQGVKCTKQKYLNRAVQRKVIPKCERNGWRVEKKKVVVVLCFACFVFRVLCVSRALCFACLVTEHKRVIYNYLRKNCSFKTLLCKV